MFPTTQRFLRYVALDTMSDETNPACPSSKNQLLLGAQLVEEMAALGISDARMDGHGYVYGSIPATAEGLPSIGLIAHMDTSPSLSGAHCKPALIKAYDGKDLLLNPQKQIVLSPAQFPELLDYIGQDLLVTDGTTLLGADDKAGIAEILSAAEVLLQTPSLRHGKIALAFTPDEEIGRGADLFDVAAFGADFAYTADGGRIGELEYENFNAASAKITVNGINIHPGLAKNQMKNALLMAMELQGMLPPAETPAHTCGYEGFFHLCSMAGNEEQAVMDYIIRDHDAAAFARRKAKLAQICAYLNEQYGAGSFQAEIKDSYYNMKEKILPCIHIVDRAKAALERAGVAPIVQPIRGGTDGSRLSYMGLPCPNLGTGGQNFHGRYEFISVQAMEKAVEILVHLVTER